MWHIVIITAALHNYNLPCYQRLWRFTWKDYVLRFVTTLQVSKLDVNEDRIQLAHSVHLIEDFFSPKGEELLKYSAYEVYRNIMRNTCSGKCGLIILADSESDYISLSQPKEVFLLFYLPRQSSIEVEMMIFSTTNTAGSSFRKILHGTRYAPPVKICTSRNIWG